MSHEWADYSWIHDEKWHYRIKIGQVRLDISYLNGKFTLEILGKKSYDLIGKFRNKDRTGGLGLSQEYNKTVKEKLG